MGFMLMLLDNLSLLDQPIELCVKRKVFRAIDLLITCSSLADFANHHFQAAYFAIIKFAEVIQHFDEVEFLEEDGVALIVRK
jgi:hypothetical protein